MTRAQQRAARVEPAATYPLRLSVLGRPPTSAELRDEIADWGHYGVMLDGLIIATGVIHPRSDPASLGDHPRPSWRIIGMTVAPHHRGEGFGGLILAALLDHVRTAGGTYVWCHARIDAVGFYLRHGFDRSSATRDDPVAGSQVRLSRPLQGVPGSGGASIPGWGTATTMSAVAVPYQIAPAQTSL